MPSATLIFPLLSRFTIVPDVEFSEYSIAPLFFNAILSSFVLDKYSLGKFAISCLIDDIALTICAYTSAVGTDGKSLTTPFAIVIVTPCEVISGTLSAVPD